MQFDVVLGRGAFKTVYKAFDEREGIEVAWNQIRVVELINGSEEYAKLYTEINVLKKLKHKNIMSFYDSWIDREKHTVNFITELFTSGTLRQCAARPLASCQPCSCLTTLAPTCVVIGWKPKLERIQDWFILQQRLSNAGAVDSVWLGACSS